MKSSEGVILSSKPHMATTRDCPQVAIVMAIGPGKQLALDTLESVEAFCTEPHMVILVDDHTRDGTYEALINAKKPNWEVLRNKKHCGWHKIVRTLCFGFEQALIRTECDLILKLDVDALIIKPRLFTEALDYMHSNPRAGMFGVYEVDYNRPRNFESHKALFDKQAAWYRPLLGMRPCWKEFLRKAETNGYRRGENVFGGAYFLTRQCANAMMKLGGLNVAWHWHDFMAEDVYFAMLTVAAGFQLGHFAAPKGPLCMEWRGLPMTASALAASKYKLVHSVDRGPNTGQGENQGKTAREVFRDLRASWLSAQTRDL